MALILDGNNDCVNFGDVLDIGLNDFSWSAWIKPTDSGKGTILAKGRNIDEGKVQFYVVSGFLVLDMDYDGVEGVYYNQIASSSAVVTDSVWNWVTVTNDRSVATGGVKLYVNGSLISTGNQDAFWETHDIQNNFQHSLTTGTWDFGATYADFFQGQIAHVHYHTKVLSPTEIEDLQTTPGSVADSLVGYWPLISDANAVVSGFDGTIVGNAVFNVDDPAPLPQTYNQDSSGGAELGGIFLPALLRSEEIEGGGVEINGTVFNSLFTPEGEGEEGGEGGEEEVSTADSTTGNKGFLCQNDDEIRIYIKSSYIKKRTGNLFICDQKGALLPAITICNYKLANRIKRIREKQCESCNTCYFF